ncbi:MAG: hypothetical protein M1142_01680 [Patescibacteria group bacterium]|nr:hypothetical protein [Patescibacteria group bacterium]
MTNKVLLTILTNQISVKERIKRKIYHLIHDLNSQNGPKAVQQNLIKGLNTLKINYNCNPILKNSVTESVVVLSDVNTLKQAIQLKKAGKIKKLIAGPNIAMLPQEISSLNNYQLIDLYIHPCQFVIDWWLKIKPNFSVKQAVWYAGVDENFWKPLKNQLISKKIMIYKKTYPTKLLNTIISTLNEKSLAYEVIDYGKYNIEEYRKKLRTTSYAIFLSESESQGMALFEAWSCDVPTLVWNRGYFRWNEYTAPASSAPYLSNLTGLTFSGGQDFIKSLEEMEKIHKQVRPREWILKNGTAKISASNLLKIIKNIGSK